MTIRVGIVGAGANTRLRHLPGFQAIDGVEVVAVCNRSRASGERVAREFGIAHVHENWKELVHSEEVDAVCIGTWPYLHAPITLECLAADKHVLTEARMAMTLAEARSMYEASTGSQKVAMVVPAPLFLEHEPALLELLSDGFFGDLLEVHVSALSGGYDPSAPIHWRQCREYSGNNVLLLGIVNETVRRYAGHEVSVQAEAQTFTTERFDPESGRRRPVDVPESLGVIARLKGGATGVYHLSSVARFGRGPELELYGTRGSARLCAGEAWIGGEGDQEMRRLEVPPERRGGWQVEQDFIDAIRNGKAVTHTSFADGVRYMEFTEAVQLSLKEGRRIALPLG